MLVFTRSRSCYLHEAGLRRLTSMIARGAAKRWLLPAVHAEDPPEQYVCVPRCAGFSGSFWASYHEVIPRAPGFDDRHQLYQLYHYLNHYNLFGSGILSGQWRNS